MPDIPPHAAEYERDLAIDKLVQQFNRAERAERRELAAEARHDRKDKELQVALAEIERLRKALEFYENPDIYKPHPNGPAFDRRDLSFHARATLRAGTLGRVDDE